MPTLDEMTCLHNYRPGHNEFYNIWIECDDDEGGPTKYCLMGGYGRAAASTGEQEEKGVYLSPVRAVAAAKKLAREKTARGYVDVLSEAYGGHLTWFLVAIKMTNVRNLKRNLEPLYDVPIFIPARNPQTGILQHPRSS